MARSVDFETVQKRRTFRKCPACGAEWSDSREYCRRCAVWIAASDKHEDLLWFLPKEGSLKAHYRCLSDGVHEATVLSIACCENVYSDGSSCMDLLSAAFADIIEKGGIPGQGPQGHLAGCFVEENLSEAALRAAELALALRVRSESDRVRTFVGLNTGPIAIEHGKVSGGVLGYAEALSFSLLPKMVVASSSTFHLINSFYDCNGTGPMGLWGREEDVSTTVYVVAGLKAASSWKRHLDENPLPFIGRGDELNLLRRWWEESHSEKSSGVTVHLIGDPGSGKSRMLQAFLGKLKEKENNAKVLKLAGFNYGSVPGLLVEEFMAECTRAGPLDENRLSHDDVRAQDRKGKLPKSIGPRARLVTKEVARLRSRGPLLIVIDDVHWADDDSVKVFQKAFENVPAGVMLIVSYRPSGSRLGELFGHADEKRITLSPLGQGEARKISVFHQPQKDIFSESVWQAIWEKSKGNPLYVEEATELLGSGKGLSEDFRHETRSNSLNLPDTIAGLILARIRKWADHELRELRAELGVRWGGSPAAGLARIERQINDWLDRIETQRYLERTEIAQCLSELDAFESRIVELCLVGGMTRPLTTRLGEALSRLYDGGHEDYYQGLVRSSRELRNRARVGRQALLAGRRAYRKGRLDQAVRFYTFAEGVLSREDLSRGEFLDQAADANFMLGRTKEAARLYQEALKELHPQDLHTEETVFRLFAARILSGETVDLTSCQCRFNHPVWSLLLGALMGLVSRDHKTAASFADKAEQASYDWRTRSYSLLGKSLARLLEGNMRKSAESCAALAENIREGGFSLFSLGLHWALSQIEEDPFRKRHRKMVRVIAKGIGVTPGRAVSPLLWEKAKRKGYGISLSPLDQEPDKQNGPHQKILPAKGTRSSRTKPPPGFFDLLFS